MFPTMRESRKIKIRSQKLQGMTRFPKSIIWLGIFSRAYHRQIMRTLKSQGSKVRQSEGGSNKSKIHRLVKSLIAQLLRLNQSKKAIHIMMSNIVKTLVKALMLLTIWKNLLRKFQWEALGKSHIKSSQVDFLKIIWLNSTQKSQQALVKPRRKELKNLQPQLIMWL